MEARKSLAYIGLTLFGVFQMDASEASDVNYTGPLLTPGAAILPRGTDAPVLPGSGRRGWLARATCRSVIGGHRATHN